MKVLALAMLILAALSGLADAGCNPREECNRRCILRDRVNDQCIKWQSEPSCEVRKAECHKCMKPFLLMGMSEQSAADRC